VARPELGVKRVCPTTGKKFYDLNRDPIVSPYTGEVIQRVVFEPTTRRGVSVAAPAPKPVARDEEDTDLENADVELVSLEEADDESAAPGKAVPAGDEDLDVDVDDGNDDDTFLEEDEDEGDDVSDLIGDGIESDDEQ
jgi:uncharacterized protein (TIGR02300 family)